MNYISKHISNFIIELAKAYPSMNTNVQYDNQDETYIIYHDYSNYETDESFQNLAVDLIRKNLWSKDIYIGFSYRPESVEFSLKKNVQAEKINIEFNCSTDTGNSNLYEGKIERNDAINANIKTEYSVAVGTNIKETDLLGAA